MEYLATLRPAATLAKKGNQTGFTRAGHEGRDSDHGAIIPTRGEIGAKPVRSR